MCGVSVVGQYIDRRIDEKITPEDLEDWQFVQKLSHSVTSDLEEETKSLFRQLGAWKTEVEEVLQEAQSDEDFKAIDLSGYFD